jgi:hypothetical protein
VLFAQRRRRRNYCDAPRSFEEGQPGIVSERPTPKRTTEYFQLQGHHTDSRGLRDTILAREEEFALLTSAIFPEALFCFLAREEVRIHASTVN